MSDQIGIEAKTAVKSQEEIDKEELLKDAAYGLGKVLDRHLLIEEGMTTDQIEKIAKRDMSMPWSSILLCEKIINTVLNMEVAKKMEYDPQPKSPATIEERLKACADGDRNNTLYAIACEEFSKMGAYIPSENEAANYTIVLNNYFSNPLGTVEAGQVGKDARRMALKRVSIKELMKQDEPTKQEEDKELNRLIEQTINEDIRGIRTTLTYVPMVNDVAFTAAVEAASRDYAIRLSDIIGSSFVQDDNLLNNLRSIKWNMKEQVHMFFKLIISNYMQLLENIHTEIGIENFNWDVVAGEGVVARLIISYEVKTKYSTWPETRNLDLLNFQILV